MCPLGHRYSARRSCICKRQALNKSAGPTAQDQQPGTPATYEFEAFVRIPYESAEISWILEEALRTARSFAEHPSGWLIFTGSYGSGKTHLAAAVANYRVEHGLPVLFIVAPDLLDHLRATYAPDSPVTYDERFQQVRDVEVLILDDLAPEHHPLATESYINC